MKTTKLFFMAALALMTAACSNSDNDILTPAEQPAKAQGITITAKLAPKSSVSGTRKVTEGTGAQAGTIVAEWETHEHIAILYEVSGTKYNADATIEGVDANGVATISFTVASGTPDNTECTLVYPGNAVNDDKTGVKAYADLLASQDGTLSYNLDVRVGAGKIQTTTPSLDVTTQPAAQYSIFKFTAQNISGTGITPSEFKVSDSEGNVITTVSPSSSAFYVALPALSAGTYWFSATAGSKPYIAKGAVGTATTAGNYYQSTVKMATIGDVILSDGKFAAPSSTGTKVAMIAYVGNDAETSTTYNHGLALALGDVSDTKNWCSQTGATCLSTGHQFDSEAGAKGDMAGIANTDALVNNTTGHTHDAAKAARDYNSGTHPAGTSAWFLPSAGQWDKMATAAGGYANLIANAGLQGGDAAYWSSTEGGANFAWLFDSSNGKLDGYDKDYDFRVRACLAF